MVTEGDALSQNNLAFQIKSSLNQVCLIVWEFCVFIPCYLFELTMCSVVRMLQVIHLPNAFLVLSQLTVLSFFDPLKALCPVTLPTKMHDTMTLYVGWGI